MKEKPCSSEVPFIRKCLPGGMLVTVRLMLASPAACAPKGSSSHSSSSTKPFQDSGLEHRGTQGQPGVTQAWLHAQHKSQAPLSPRVASLHPAFLQSRWDLVGQGLTLPAP